MNPWIMYVGVMAIGLVVLGLGGEFLVRGAGRLARALGVSALVVGLTVVAFGTSAPEAAVTVLAAAQGIPSLAVGNVVGSNIANILLILGIAATIAPLTVSRSLIRVDGPVMIVSAAALLSVALVAGQITRWAGVVFVMGLAVYTFMTYFLARRNYPVVATASADEEKPLTGFARKSWYNLAMVVAGIGGLVYGARLIVYGASGMAGLLGVSEHVIGLTIVAIGTSLPELATTIVAARQKQPDIAIGNVVGSNIFNVLFVTGLASLARPLPVPPEILHFDGPLMLVVCVVFYPVVYTGRKVTRLEGIVLLIAYVAYLTWTAMHAQTSAV